VVHLLPHYRAVHQEEPKGIIRTAICKLQASRHQ